MVQVTVGNNVKRNKVVVANETTLRQVLEQNEIDYTRGAMHLDGAPLQPGDLDKSFSQLGIASSCYLLNVVKTDNANPIQTYNASPLRKAARFIGRFFARI